MRSQASLRPLRDAEGFYHCRLCGKRLPESRRFFCSDEHAAAFEESYSPDDSQAQIKALLNTTEEQALQAEIESFEEWAKDPSKHKMFHLCADCPETCKVWQPDPQTPTQIVCRKTAPERFK